MDGKQKVISKDRLKTLTFNHGKINHAVYGSTADELSGEIPFLTISRNSHGDPVPARKETELKALAKALQKDSRLLWEEELDEDILEKIYDTALMVGFIIPEHTVDSFEFQLTLKLWLILKVIFESFAEAGMMDDLEMDLKDYDMVAKRAEILQEIIGSFRNESDDLECPTLHSKQKSLVTYVKAFSREFKKVSNYKTRSKAFKKESEKTFYKMFSATKEAQAPEGYGLKFWARSSSCSNHLELVAFLDGSSVSPEVRKTDAFKKFQFSFGEAAACFETVMSLREDIKHEDPKQSAILKLVGNGTALQSAFDSYLARLHKSLKDLSEASKILLAIDSEDDNIEGFLKCAEDFLNGLLYWYAHTLGYTIE